MRVKAFDITRRLLETYDPRFGIINYDIDNAYPQRVRNMINDSPRATHVRRISERFIKGDGFKDKKYYQQKVNRKGDTMNTLLRAHSEDLSYFNGFAMHFNYNANYKIAEINYIPFENVRLPHERNPEKTGQFCLYDDWARWKRAYIKQENLEWIHGFNPNPNIIENEVAEADGWNNYRGQVLYVLCNVNAYYPLSPFDPCLEDVDTDGQLKQFSNNTVRKEFSPSVILFSRTREEAEGADREQDQPAIYPFGDGYSNSSGADTQLKKFMGAERNGKLLHWQGETEDDEPKFIPIPENQADQKYVNITDNVRENIREAGLVPTVLMGDETPGKLGLANEMPANIAYYNWLMLDYRRKMQETHELIYPFFAETNMNISKDFSIVPVNIIIPVVGTGGTQEVSESQTSTGQAPPTNAPTGGAPNA